MYILLEKYTTFYSKSIPPQTRNPVSYLCNPQEAKGGKDEREARDNLTVFSFGSYSA